MPAIDPITIQFVAGGVADIERAFATVRQRAEQLEQSIGRATRTGANERSNLVKREVEDRVRAAEMLGVKLSAAERQRVAGMERSRQEAVRIENRLSQEMNRISEQAARQRVRHEMQANQQIERDRERMARAEERRHTQMMSRLGRMGGIVGRAGVNSLFSLGHHAASAAMIGGGFFLADATRDMFRAQRASQLIVNAVTTGATPPPGANVANIMGQAGAVAGMTGMSKADIAEGALEYSRKAKGGDIKGTLGNMEFFAKMSKVTGTDIREVASAAGMLQSQNPGLDSKGMQGMLLDVLAQTHGGSLSMTDIAKQVGKIASTRSSFAVNGKQSEADVQRKLLGLAQFTAAESTTGQAGMTMSAFTNEARTDLAKKGGGALRGMGVHVLPNGRIESPEQMIEAVIAKTGGDMNKITSVFHAKGSRVFTPYASAYQDVIAKGGSKEDAVAEVHRMIKSITETTMTMDNFNKRFEDTMSQPQERFNRAMEKLKDSAERGLGPVMEKLASKLEEHLPAIQDAFDKIISGGGQLAEFFIDNPLKGIGAIIALKVGADITQAAIGQSVKFAMEKAIESGVAGKFGAGLAIGVLAATVTKLIIDEVSDADIKKQQQVVSGEIQSENAISNARAAREAGKVTPEQLSDLMNRRSQLQDQLQSQAANPMLGAASMSAVAMLTGQTDKAKEIQESAEKKKADEVRNTSNELKKLNAEIAKTAAALALLSSAGTTGARGTPMQPEGRH